MKNWNEVEIICDRCQKSILNDYNLKRYLLVENFFKENYMLFCRCNSHFIVADLMVAPYAAALPAIPFVVVGIDTSLPEASVIPSLKFRFLNNR